MQGAGRSRRYARGQSLRLILALCIAIFAAPATAGERPPSNFGSPCQQEGM